MFETTNQIGTGWHQTGGSRRWAEISPEGLVQLSLQKLVDGAFAWIPRGLWYSPILCSKNPLSWKTSRVDLSHCSLGERKHPGRTIHVIHFLDPWPKRLAPPKLSQENGLRNYEGLQWQTMKDFNEKPSIFSQVSHWSPSRLTIAGCWEDPVTAEMMWCRRCTSSNINRGGPTSFLGQWPVKTLHCSNIDPNNSFHLFKAPAKVNLHSNRTSYPLVNIQKTMENHNF